MSKFLATAAMVVGGVALVATGVGAVAAVGVGVSASTVATAATVAKVAGFAAAALMATSSLTAPKASGGGSPDQWKADPNAGIDIVFGDAYSGGHIVYRQAYGSKNKYQSIVTEWSMGPVQSIDTLYIDQIARAVNGTAVDVPNQGFIHEARQLGQCPEPAALTLGPVQPFGWTAAHKLSGKAATIMTFEYDTKGTNTQTSMPTCGWRGKGVLCYDARKDSTYPGGSGPQRANDQTTWAWSDNPYVVGTTWCLGWRQNGKLVAGVGLPASGLILDQFVEGANIADLNKWRVGGVKSTTDDKWDVLKDILQAGAGEPLRLGAMLGCIVSTPRVSLATIDRNARAQGDVTVVAMQARRDRMNAVVPRYWSEEVSTDPTTGTSTTTWAEVAAKPVIVDEYVAADRRQVRKEVSYPLVQCFAGEELDQVATLARYDIENAREFGPITLPLKIRWLGYKPGDVVTLDLPEAGLYGQTVMILTRSLDAGSGVVTITARSETLAKHPFALGQTAVPPTSPGLPANAWQFGAPGSVNTPDTAGDGVIDDRAPLLTSLGAGGSVQVNAGTYYLSDITRPAATDLVLKVDPAAIFTGPGEIDLKNSLPNIPSPVWSPDLYSKTYGPGWNGIKNIFQIASYANAAVVRGGSAVGPAVVALFGHGQTSVEGAAAWGLNVVGYANAPNSVAIANETDSGALVAGGKAYNTVLVSSGFFPSISAIQVQSNKAGGSFIDGIVFNNRQTTSVSGTGEPVVTDIPAVTGTLISADEGGSERFVRSRMVHTISEWESQNFVVGPSYVPAAGAGRRYARVDATSGGVYIRARDDGSNATHLYLGSVGLGSVQILTGRGGSGEVVQMEIRHAPGATDHLAMIGGIGDVEIGTAGASATSSVSIRGRGANGGVKLRDGLGAVRVQATPSGVGFNGADPSIPQLAANLPTDGTATNASLAAALNSQAAALRALGLAA